MKSETHLWRGAKLVALLFAALANDECNAQSQLSYHFFKERRPLKLDTSRVAILQTHATVGVGLGSSLKRFGFAPEEPQALPIRGWSIAKSTTAGSADAAARDLA